MITFSNPRLTATFDNWPLGGARRGRCVFGIEFNPNKGYRFTRVTTGKPKVTTYGGAGAIVDGSDGRTYLIQWAGLYDFIKVLRSDFMCAGEEVTGKASGGVFPGDPLYDTLDALIAQVQGGEIPLKSSEP